MFQCCVNIKDKAAEMYRGSRENQGQLSPRTLSFSLFAYLAGLKLGQALPAVCWSRGCDISPELPLAAVSSQGWYEVSGGGGEPDLPPADRGVKQSDSAEAAG